MKEEIQEKIDRARQGLPPKPSKTRKISGALITVNLIVVLVLMFVYKKTPMRQFSTTTLEYDRVSYSIVIAKNTKTGRHILTTSLRSLAPGEMTARYRTSVMSVIFQSEGQFIYGTEIGVDTTLLVLKPYENRVLETMMEDRKITDFIDNHPQSLIPRRKSNLFGENQYLPLTAVITINTEKPVKLSMEMRYMVD